MHFFSKKCPRCGKTKAYHRIYSTRYAPAAPLAIGGYFLAVVFDQSRKPQFRCEQCRTAFHSHTILSLLFLFFWAWFVLAAIMIILGIVLDMLWSLAGSTFGP